MNEKLNEMNNMLAICDKQLDTLNATLSLANLIRGLIEEDRDVNYINQYIMTTIKVGLSTKESLLEQIQKLHKEISVHHAKMTNEGCPKELIEQWGDV